MGLVGLGLVLKGIGGLTGFPPPTNLRVEGSRLNFAGKEQGAAGWEEVGAGQSWKKPTALNGELSVIGVESSLASVLWGVLAGSVGECTRGAAASK